jgi:2-methylcitrate dehydratase PrpD
MSPPRFVKDADTSVLMRLAHYAAGLRVDAMPREVVAKAKLCILDAISGCLTIGANMEGRSALSLALSHSSNGTATVYGTSVLCSPSDAAFVNAVSAAGTGRSDTHATSATHPGTAIVPAALAMAEATGRSGSAAIEAVVAGYEVMCRLGRALITPEFASVFRPTGMVAPTGAAIAAGLALGLDPKRLMHAASLATQTASGLNEWANAGTPELPFHSGFAARSGVDCAFLAEAGMVSASTILEGRAGLLAGYGALHRLAALTDGLGDDYQILQIVYKPAPACIYVQTPSQIAQRMVRDHSIDLTAIEVVQIHLSRAALMYPGCNDRGPITDPQAAKLSIQFGVASVLNAGGVFDSNWRDFADPRVNAIASRCELIEDEVLTAAAPRQGGRICIRLRDGKVIEDRQDDFLSMSGTDLVERFAKVAEPRLGRAQCMRMIAAIEGLEDLPDVRELTAGLRVASG